MHPSMDDASTTSLCLSVSLFLSLSFFHFPLLAASKIRKLHPRGATVLPHFVGPWIKVTSRDIKSIDMTTFRSDLKHRFSNVIDDCQEFNDACSHVMNQHAPIKTRTVTERIVSPWFGLEQKEIKQEKRRAERKWRKTDL